MRVLITTIIFVLGGCTALPGGKVVESTTIVYTAGSSQYTAAVEVSVLAPEVYATLLRVLTENPAVEVVSRKDKALLVEVARESKRLTAQVTRLGESSSLLYVWADAGASGKTGQELAISVVERVCDELGVSFELVSY